MGMLLLDKHNLNIDVEAGGRVAIQAKALAREGRFAIAVSPSEKFAVRYTPYRRRRGDSRIAPTPSFPLLTSCPRRVDWNEHR